jgi:hypothetical protein
VALLLFALAVVIFLPALGGAFINWDDNLYVTHNPRIQNLNLARFFNLWSPADALAGKFVEYFPLRDSIYALIWFLTPAKTWLFHGVQILLHALNGVLVFALLRVLGLERRGAGMGAAFFALHPVHVESVAWISGLKDPLFLAFFLLGALAFFQRHRFAAAQALSIVFLVLGLLCKAMVLTFVPLVFLAATLIRGEDVRKTAMALGPHAVISGLFLILFLFVGRANAVILEPYGGTQLFAMLFGLWCLFQYVGLMVFPLQLSTFYLLEPIASFSDWRIWVTLGAGVVLGGALFKSRHRHKKTLIFLALGFWVALLPVLHVVTIPVFMADRYLYLASVVVAFGAGWGSQFLPPKKALAVATVVGALLLIQTQMRIAVWEQSATVWLDALDQPGADENSLILFQYGAALAALGNAEGAGKVNTHILELAKSKKVPDIHLKAAHHQLATLALEGKRLSQAHVHIKAMKDLGADSRRVRQLLARAHTVEGKPEEAIALFDALQQEAPLLPIEQIPLAHALALVGDEDRAKKVVNQILAYQVGLCGPLKKTAAAPLLPGICNQGL